MQFTEKDKETASTFGDKVVDVLIDAGRGILGALGEGIKQIQITEKTSEKQKKEQVKKNNTLIARQKYASLSGLLQ